MTVKVGINGFGRIGRNVMRAALEKNTKEIEKPITNLSIENPKYLYVAFLPKSSNMSLKVLYGDGKIMLFKSIKADTKNQTPIKNRNPRKNIKYLLRNTFISNFAYSKYS